MLARQGRIAGQIHQAGDLYTGVAQSDIISEDAARKTALQRDMDATDKEIDALVYELYGLTDDEIRIVEG